MIKKRILCADRLIVLLASEWETSLITTEALCVIFCVTTYTTS